MIERLRPRPTRALDLAAGTALVFMVALAWPGDGYAQTPANSKARPDDLLKSAPFDRITLTDNSVFEVEPLNPRPLPPLDKKRPRTVAEIEDLPEKARPRRKDAFEKKDDEVDQQVIIHMMEGEPRDFKVKRGSIKDVEYFEDMLLVEADRLTKGGEFTRAFERLQVVKTRDPGWRGLDDRVNKLLFEEGGVALAEDNARGLRLLTDLRSRKPDYPGLGDRLASTFARQVERALAANDYVAGRRLIREVEALTSRNPEARAAREEYVGRARSLLTRAVGASPDDRVDLLAEAGRIWPELDGLEAAYRNAFKAAPTLSVAVNDLAEPVGPFPTTPASARLARLLYLPLLATDDEAATRGEVGGQLLATLEATELGKGLKIALKAGPVWSDGSRPVAAIDVARSLADRAVPASPGYSARWADLLDRVEATADDRVVIRLTRPTLKPETWLLDPIGPAHAAADGRVSSSDRGRRPVGDGPYRWDASTDGSIVLRAVDRPGSDPIRVRRLREVKYADPTSAFAAFERGEVALMEHVAPDRVGELAKEPGRFRVGRFATPAVHLIALDGREPALRNRKLRRALSMAIDRRGLLEEVVLRHKPEGDDLVVDGPFVKGSFVDAPGVEPFVYNPLLAKGLVAAARKELGGNPIRLTLEHPSTPEARAACPKIAEAFGLIGVEVTVLPRGESELEAALHAGRRFAMAYRSIRPTRPLQDAGPLLLPGYDAPPEVDALASAASPRILQLLIKLDQAPETTSARALALQIDRESRDELPVLPLWQIRDHYAWRSQLKGPAESIDDLYQGIAGWEVEPWFAKD